MKQRGSVSVGRLGTGEEDLRVGSNQGSYLEEVTCGSFYTSACWPALVIRPIQPAPGPQSLSLPAGLSR